MIVVAALGDATAGDNAAAGRWTRERTSRATPPEWTQALQRVGEERDAIAAGLMDVASDTKVSHFTRVQAFVHLGRVPTKAVIDFCLANLPIHLSDVEVDQDDDIVKMRPARYALAQIGPAAALSVIVWVESRDLPKDAITDAAWVLRYALGVEVARSLLTAMESTRQGGRRDRLALVRQALPPA